VIGQLAAFLGISALVIVTPGQDTALTIRNTFAGGRAAGVRTALGVSSGQAIWALATSAGLATLIVASEPAFVALKLAGGAYLVYLGAEALVAAVRGRPAEMERASAPGRAYRQGMVSNLGNPKMAIFFTSLLPQFATSFAGMLALGTVFCAMTLAWLSAYAWALERLSRMHRLRRAIDALTGTALVALGLRVLTTDELTN
jgi:threonine/homoserine/homoserine lactone efflux protein